MNGVWNAPDTCRGMTFLAPSSLAMTLAAGGVLVELLADATTILLPATRADLARALSRLKISRLLDGYRGKPAADGPRYKALGNSMAVNCMRWIGRRIEMVERL